jgi:hypothetical protein
MAGVRLLARPERGMLRTYRGDRLSAVEGVRERLNSRVAERLELPAPVGEDARVFLAVHGGLAPRGLRGVRLA